MSRRFSRRTMVLASAALCLRGANATAAPLPVLKVAGVPEESVTPALWARQSGLFRRYGVDVVIDPQRSGSAIAAGVAGGAYAIGKSSIVALITAHAKGIPFVLVAPGGLYEAANPTIGLIAKTDGPIRSAADLNGKTVAVSSLNDLYTVATKAWVDLHGGDSSTLKLVELPLSAVAESIATGRIDAGGDGTPQIEEDVGSGKVRILGRLYDAIAPVFMYTAWFAMRDFLNANRPAAQGFARAMRDAARYVNGHHQQTIDVLAKFTAVDPGIIAKMQRATEGTTLDPRLLQPVIEVCAKYKVIPAPFDAREMIATGLA